MRYIIPMKWIETAQTYQKKDPAARSLLEIILLYPGYHALGWYRIAHFFYRHRWFFLARLLSQLGRFFTQIEIHPGATIGRRLVIDHGAGIVIGETAIIGDDCLLYHGVTLGGTHHESRKRHPTLQDRVTVGAGAKILGDITLGDDVIVGANAVVTKSVESGVTVVGIPARPMR